MIKLKFVNHSRRQGIAIDDPIEPNSLLFFYDSWNDHGYQVSFDVSYFDEKGNETNVGIYRIFYRDDVLSTDLDIYEIPYDVESPTDLDWSYIVLKFGRLPDDLFTLEELDSNYYFSLALSQDFYTNLYRLLPQDCTHILNKLCDITQKDLSSIQAFLRAEAINTWGDDVFSKVIFREFRGNPKSIVDLASVLKQIDKDITVSNYLEWDNFNKILEKATKGQLNQIIDHFMNKSVYTELEKIIAHFQENKAQLSPDYKTNFILDLIKCNEFEQLAITFESLLDLDLLKIYTAVTEIEKILRYGGENEFQFVHYTNLSVLDILVKEIQDEESQPKLRLSNARQMNDPKEGRTLLELIGIDIEQIEQRDYVPSSFFVSSMAKVEGDIEDSLPMWKQYGGDTAGISLTYHDEYIKSLIETPGVKVYRVAYVGKDEDELKEQLNTIKTTIEDNEGLDRNKVMEIIEPVRYLFKEGSYSYENEYRIIVNRESDKSTIKCIKSDDMKVPRLFTFVDAGNIPLRYRKVILGPKADDIDFVAPYVKHIDSNIEIRKSTIPYR